MCKCYIDTTLVAGEKMGCCFKIAKSGEMGYNKSKKIVRSESYSNG